MGCSYVTKYKRLLGEEEEGGGGGGVRGPLS